MVNLVFLSGSTIIVAALLSCIFMEIRNSLRRQTAETEEQLGSEEEESDVDLE